MKNITKIIAVPLLLLISLFTHNKMIAQVFDCVDPNTGVKSSGTFNVTCIGSLKSDNSTGVEYKIYFDSGLHIC